MFHQAVPCLQSLLFSLTAWKCG